MHDSTSPVDCSQNGDNCWAEINLSALGCNARLLEGLGAKLMAVLKADAYGHGIALIAPELMRRGVRSFGVATAAEGAEMRRLVGWEADIYVMTAALPEDAARLVQERLVPFVSSPELLSALSQAATAARLTSRLHLEVDTGIGRAGFEPGEFKAALDHAVSLPGLDVCGVCTHFTAGENAEDAHSQHRRFERLIREQIPPALLAGLTIHAANSPGILNVPGARWGMIRPGLLLYGIAPAGSGPAALPGGEELKPVLALRARTLLVRDLAAGTPISYGRTYILPRSARIATVGIGYGDGYSRQFSNRGRVLLPNGERAEIRGRVCMDQICIELPQNNSLAPGDTITLVGGADGEQLRAAEIAELIDATPHEITTCLTRRVQRFPVSGEA